MALTLNLDADQASAAMLHAFGDVPAADTGIVYSDGVLYVPDAHAAKFANLPTGTPVAMLKRYAASKRWAVQNAGALWEGATVPTDDASRTAVAQAIQSIDLQILTAPVPWKLPGGFTSLTRSQLVSMAQAMAAHVQGAFADEAAVLAGVASGTITTTSQIDAEF